MDNEDRRRYFAVDSLFLDIVTPVFQCRIQEAYTALRFESFQAFMNSLKVVHHLFHLRHRTLECCMDDENCPKQNAPLPLNQLQWKKLYTEKPSQASHRCHCKFTANAVQLTEIDISLSSLILLNCCNISPPEEEAVERLRQYKNECVSHTPTACITQTKFNTLWSEFVTYILRLDPTKQDNLDFRKNDVSCVCGSEMIIPAYKDQPGRHRKQYTIGQAIFYLHQQFSLNSLFNGDEGRFVSDIKIIDDGRLLLCVLNKSILLICNKDGSNADSIPIRGTPYCITPVNSSTVAVIVVKPFRGNCIELYDINYKIKLKWIQVPGMKSSCGISTINNKLVVGGLRKLMIVNHQREETIQTIKLRCTPEAIHAAEDKIFFKNHRTGFISNETKKLKWYNLSRKEVKGKILSSYPYSITSLRDGSLYVLCIDGSIPHVSGDLKNEKAVDTNNVEALKSVNSISCNTNNNTMVLRSNMILSIFQKQN